MTLVEADRASGVAGRPRERAHKNDDYGKSFTAFPMGGAPRGINRVHGKIVISLQKK